jgi:hypothetical protein
MSLQWKTVYAICVIGMMMVAASSAQIVSTAPVRIGKKGQNQATHPHANQGVNQSSSCKAILSQSKQLLAQERQLHQQAKGMLAQEKAYIHQASAIEAQRVAMERSMRAGHGNPSEEAQLKQMEQQRVGFEHQAEQQAKERKQIELQADEVNRQRVALERQHNEECGGHHKIQN